MFLLDTREKQVHVVCSWFNACWNRVRTAATQKHETGSQKQIKNYPCKKSTQKQEYSKARKTVGTPFKTTMTMTKSRFTTQVLLYLKYCFFGECTQYVCTTMLWFYSFARQMLFRNFFVDLLLNNVKWWNRRSLL